MNLLTRLGMLVLGQLANSGHAKVGQLELVRPLAPNLVIMNWV